MHVHCLLLDGGAFLADPLLDRAQEAHGGGARAAVGLEGDRHEEVGVEVVQGRVVVLLIMECWSATLPRFTPNPAPTALGPVCVPPGKATLTSSARLASPKRTKRSAHMKWPGEVAFLLKLPFFSSRVM